MSRAFTFNSGANDLFTLSVKNIGATLQEKHPEDVVLVRGGIESLLAEPVSRRVEMTFELCEREFRHSYRSTVEVGKSLFLGFGKFNKG